MLQRATTGSSYRRALPVILRSRVAVTASFRLGVDPGDTTIPAGDEGHRLHGVLVLFGVVALVL